MNEQPEALRLADELSIQDQCDFYKVCEGAAAELRRLHADNERLRKVPKWFHCDMHGQGNLNAWGCPECVRELREGNSVLEEALKIQKEEITKAAMAAAAIAIDKAIELEREACARACDEYVGPGSIFAKVIRARGQEQPR